MAEGFKEEEDVQKFADRMLETGYARQRAEREIFQKQRWEE
jgi:hypothetical protein